MTLNSVGDLLKAICVHWPNAKKNILDPEGKISRTVAEEWYKRIGFLDDEKIDELFNNYLVNPDLNKYPPGVPYFLGHKIEKKTNYFRAPKNENRYRVSKRGDLIDQEGRVYADPEDPEGIFYINANGYLCKKDASGQEIVWYR